MKFRLIPAGVVFAGRSSRPPRHVGARATPVEQHEQNSFDASTLPSFLPSSPSRFSLSSPADARPFAQVASCHLHQGENECWRLIADRNRPELLLEGEVVLDLLPGFEPELTPDFPFPLASISHPPSSSR